MQIIDLRINDLDLREQTAVLLNDAFPLEDGYPTMEAAREEVGELLEDGKIVRIAFADNLVLGVIGGQQSYGGRSWELHPLVVRREFRGRGVGARLVEDLQEIIACRGGGTLYLGTDDVLGQTNVANRDLFPGVLAKLADIENTGGHPMGFYLRQGFEVVGIIPDANGLGKPDILMAKRIAPR